ncbi:MAG: type II toxin-antitoxin system prevent-host-death family antitoxin [Gammaproteobacteria bacterium]|nr:type II toxin-antitoxin system prevent-host-death family antitoxin [Gammaproteobacteria bacterium]
MMLSVGIKTLNNRLSEYVRLAASGETILVTHRNRVVAELKAPRPTRSPDLADAFLADAVRKGWLRAPLLSSDGALPESNPVAPLSEILQELDADRDNR